MPTLEELARLNIDKQLIACGWVIQDLSGLNRYASLGVAVREFPLETGEAGNYAVGLSANIPHVGVDGIRLETLQEWLTVGADGVRPNMEWADIMRPNRNNHEIQP